MNVRGSASKAVFQGSGSSGSSVLPVLSPDLWFKPEDLSSYSNGGNINYWKNNGTYGSNYDLVYNGSLSNSAGTPNYLLKQSVGGFNCAYNDNTNRVLYFRAFQNSPGSGGVYLFDGTSGGGTTYLDRTIFYVYYSLSGYTSAFGTYSGNYTTYGYSHNYGNVGFAYSGYYVLVESNDGFPIGSSNSTTYDGNVIAAAGHVQGPSIGNLKTWKNRTGSMTSYTYSDGLSSQVNPVGIGYSRSSTCNNGYLFEIIVYGRALSDNEINSVRSYLGTKYGGTVNS